MFKTKLFFLNLLALIAINVTFACECGTEGVATRIFRGSKARANKYPWLALVRVWPSRKSNAFHQCAGALIDETHVVTAAHCVTGDNGKVSKSSNIDVFLGRARSMSDQSKPSSVSAVWADSNFDARLLNHDFAILTLSKSIVYNQTVAPICLPNNENNLSKLVVTGWGMTSPGGSASDDLMEAEVDYIDTNKCNNIKKDYIMRINGFPEFMRDHVSIEGITETQLCAINTKTSANFCQGDSGGPIMRKGTNGRYYLIGLVSGSWSQCGEEKDASGLYTRILYYKDIIQSVSPNACWQD